LLRLQEIAMLTLFLLLTTFAPAQKPDAETQALERINFFRKQAGLAAVTADPELSKGCLAHAQYLAKNADHPSAKGLGMHKEDPKLPGYTEEGARAGASSVIFPTGDQVGAVNGWMATLFHRIPLLDPKLTKVGLGFAKGGQNGGFFVVDTITGRDGKDRTQPVLYPVDEQKDVPLKFTPELPQAVPAAKENNAGYPVTVIFPPDAGVKDVTAVLKDGAGKEVDIWLSTPEQPAGDHKQFQRNTVCLIAKAALKPRTTYTVTVKATVNDEAWSQKWSFTTVKK
jgi:hypothetical protein